MNIGICRFQPFPSRQKATLQEDYVIGLRFAYNPVLIGVLKRLLRKYDQEARNVERRIRIAGSWLPQHRVWYVESSVWPQIKTELWQVYPDITYVIVAPPTQQAA
ncbi:MAG: hypothetical protein ACXWQ5_00510 [Ktedonobacterales bacterium]